MLCTASLSLSASLATFIYLKLALYNFSLTHAAHFRMAGDRKVNVDSSFSAQKAGVKFPCSVSEGGRKFTLGEGSKERAVSVSSAPGTHKSSSSFGRPSSPSAPSSLVALAPTGHPEHEDCCPPPL